MQETLIVSAFCETSQGQNFEDDNQLEEIELKNQMRIAVMEVRQQIVNMVWYKTARESFICSPVT